MKVIFETSEETNDPEKVNKAFNDIVNTAREEARNNIGVVPRTRETITAGSDVGSRLLVEANEDNKRLILNIDGINYKIDLTAI